MYFHIFQRNRKFTLAATKWGQIQNTLSTAPLYWRHTQKSRGCWGWNHKSFRPFYLLSFIGSSLLFMWIIKNPCIPGKNYHVTFPHSIPANRLRKGEYREAPWRGIVTDRVRCEKGRTMGPFCVAWLVRCLKHNMRCTHKVSISLLSNAFAGQEWLRGTGKRPHLAIYFVV